MLVTGWAPHGRELICPLGRNGSALCALEASVCPRSMPKEDGEWKTGELVGLEGKLCK